MSPAQFCRLAGNAKDRASESIILRQTRQTLAQFESSVRDQARWRKRRLTSEDFVAHADVKDADKWAPEIGSLVVVAPCATRVPVSLPLLPVSQERKEQRAEQNLGLEREGQEREKRKDEEPLQQQKDQGGHEAGVLSADGIGEGEFQRGVVVGRRIDGWYEVLLVEVCGNCYMSPCQTS